jgi:hypothetical protein
MKRQISKAIMRACFAGLAVTAVTVGGAGVASASTASPAAQSTYSSHGHFCNPWQLERWNLNGSNTVDLTLAPQNTPFTYAVTFKQFGSCLRGWLTDTYYPGGPVTLAISGTVFKDYVQFSVTYPDTTRAVRTFTGTISRWRGAVSGTWSETGTYNETGSWALAKNARPACHRYYWWSRGYCLVFPH